MQYHNCVYILDIHIIFKFIYTYLITIIVHLFVPKCQQINLGECWELMSEKFDDTINVLTGFVLNIISTCFLRVIT